MNFFNFYEKKLDDTLIFKFFLTVWLNYKKGIMQEQVQGPLSAITPMYCITPTSHETWQLVNSFQCIPWYCVSYFRHFAVYFVKQIFYLNIYLFEINFTIILLPFSFLSSSLVWNSLTNYFVSWDTLYVRCFVGHPVCTLFRGTPCMYAVYWYFSTFTS